MVEKNEIAEFKRYPNRRLYSMKKREHVALKDVIAEIFAGREVRIVNHTGGENHGKDITCEILLKALPDMEAKDPKLKLDDVLHLIRAHK